MSKTKMEHLIDGYLDLVSRTAFRILCDTKDSDAVTREVFVYAWEHYDAFDGKMSMENWILHHTCRYARLRIVRRRIMYIFGERPDLYITTAPRVQDFDDYVTKQAWELYCRVSVSFTISQRVLFALCAIEGLSESEASLITGISVRRIYSLLADAHTKFYEELRSYGKKDEYVAYVGFLRRIDDSLTEKGHLKKEIMASVR